MGGGIRMVLTKPGPQTPTFQKTEGGPLPPGNRNWSPLQAAGHPASHTPRLGPEDLSQEPTHIFRKSRPQAAGGQVSRDCRIILNIQGRSCRTSTKCLKVVAAREDREKQLFTFCV